MMPNDLIKETEELLKQARASDIKGEFQGAGVNIVLKMLQLSQRQAADAVDNLTSITQDYSALADKYAALVKEYDTMPETMFTGFSLDPVSILEILLADVERMKKIEDQSSDNWKWEYALTLKHRLKIAWKLIFRPKYDREGLERLHT